ncbi:MAG: VanZ family protein [Bacteroidales bacterium]|nr:VanZ family protein [Bacteroidales bacterium]
MKIAFSPKLNLFLYSLLLVITPFLLLQHYLQDAIGRLSDFTIDIGGQSIPVFMVLVTFTGIVAIFLLLYNYSHTRLIGLILVIFLFFVGYTTSDYYFNQHFYDIQHNWHYFAYGIYTWLAFQYFFSRGLKVEKIVLLTFLNALGISLMDEVIQVFISNRVFDLSDVAKDLWGCMIGQVFIHVVIFDLKYINLRNFKWTGFNSWKESVTWILVLEFIFAWVFLNISSVLTDVKYAGYVLLFSLLLFLMLVGGLHLGSIKKLRWLIVGAFLLWLFYPAARLLFSEPTTVVLSKHLILYKGIPVPYFDVMIYPNGLVRPVDKKESFNMRDIQKISSIGPDILVIATGSRGQGGKGFNDQVSVEMRYNHEKKKVYQLVKLPTKEACKLYNRLSKEGKSVLLIVHNS